jgi:hypothetical protein
VPDTIVYWAGVRVFAAHPRELVTTGGGGGGVVGILLVLGRHRR